MAEASSYKHPIVDLEEFERRLRGPEPIGREQPDALAELTRLVNGEMKQPAVDPLEQMFARAAQRPIASNENADAAIVKLPRAGWDRVEPAFEIKSAAPVAGDAVQLQNELRGSIHAENPQAVFEREMREMHAKYDAPSVEVIAAQSTGHTENGLAVGAAGVSHAEGLAQHLAAQSPASHHPLAHSEPQMAMEIEPVESAQAPVIHNRARPKRAPVYVMGAIAAVGLVLVGGTFAWRANSASAIKTIAVIKAPVGPVKVAAAGEGTVVPNQDASILDKSQGNGKTVAKVATADEQPIDLNLAPKAPPVVAPVIKAVVPPAAPPVPVVAESPFGPPKKVRTVAVRPDGSVIPAASALAVAPPVTPAPVPAAPIPAARPAPVVAAPAVTAPAVAPATPPAKPKATVRVVNAPKPTAATAEDGTAPLQLSNAAPKPAAAKVKVADATASVSAGTEAGGGRFAVQLAAPGSEQEAKEVSSRLARQFSSELDGRSPSVRAGENSGRTVYRVRVSNLSREAATAMCEKLKASGGNCFVASN